MIRKLSAIVTAALCVVGLAVATSAPAQANVVPSHGGYAGVDHGARPVTFSFNGTQITHFTVGSGHSALVIGTAHVTNGMWHETCGGGYCFKGGWTTDNHVSGFWRHGGSHSWVSWTATYHPVTSFTPFGGSYMGRDHRQLSVHLTYRGGFITGFTWDSNHFSGNVRVTNGKFEHCYSNFCIKGTWEDETRVVGQWRYPNSTQWTGWEMQAYAA
ncbi:hypothetical protein ABLE68_09315 [Nocardioides sp. CN2-186]|uniref:hypothetical protein n=1 Tax=Nocardioides tweenelious TaxID=3156607 RepID=UPI0032B4FC33